VRHVQFGYQGLVVAISSNYMDGRAQLTFWQMSSPLNITHLHILPLDEGKGDMFTLGMDDHFVVLFRYVEETSSRKIYIISTETKTVVQKLTIAYSEYLLYDQGVIIMRFPLFIR
jgi:hypothetical protein